jgi:NADH:ubiquinone oxidoreductase subunit 6 (subunit J)
MLILLAVVVIRTGARFILRDAHDVAGIPVVVFIDALTLLYAGSIVGLQLDVWKRARKLLAGAVAAKAAGQAVTREVTQDHAGEKPHG